MIVFLHGAGIGAGDLSPDRYPLVRRLQALGPAQVPLIEGDWLGRIGELLAPLGPEDEVIGHSHGGAMALKWIAERDPGKRLARFVGCAMPMWGEPDWEYEELCLPRDTTGAFDGIGEVWLLQARDDEIVDPGHVALYAARLPGARLRRLPAGGHDLEDEGVSGVLTEALGLSG